jgi:catechol 2,3-dioxygenase-like lactoylglutathione lyase family enzyme
MPSRTKKPRSRKQRDPLPSLAVGHVVLRVANVRVAAAFYKQIGLRQVWLRKDLAILELRGGTHLLLFPSIGKRRARRAAPFDLMAEDLDATHATAHARGLAPASIDHEERSGHRFFTIRDPDGQRLTVYSSHTEGRPV